MSTAKPTDRNALVIGGSIGGLLTAHFLMRAGWDVNVFESANRLEGRGAGIVTHSPFHKALADLEIASPEELGLNVHVRKAYGQDGKELDSLDWTQTVTSWGRLHHVLLNSFSAQRYHASHHLERVVTTESKAVCFFKNGKEYSANLVIAADGIRSTVRTQLEPESKPDYAGYVAWRGLVPEQLFDTPELKSIFPCFSFCLLPGEQALAYPVAGEDFTTGLKERRCNAVWYRPADADTELQELLTDKDGNNNGLSIAPDKIRPSVIAGMRKEAHRLSPQHAAIIERIVEPFIQPIYDVKSKSMVHGRIVLIGDAAYTARPHLAMGVGKATEDAQCLVDCLENEENIDIALARFREKRQAVNERVVDRARELGAYLQATVDSAIDRENARRFGTTEAVLRETATDKFS